jgi:hypothetical protein
VPLPPDLQVIFDELMKAYPDGLNLNQLSDELINRPVSYPEIELLIAALEEAGVDLEGPEPPVRPEELVSALAAARALTAETGKRPTVEEIAARAGLTAAVVRRALQFGRSVAT